MDFQNRVDIIACNDKQIDNKIAKYDSLKY